MTRSEFQMALDGLGYADIASGQQVSVPSSNLSSVGYDFGSKTLTITFTSGSAYLYKAVPPAVVIELLSAGSHGSFFHHNIRMSYPFSKL